MRGRLTISVVAGAILLSGSLACRVAKTTLQMDSDSRVPIFGLQLAPKEKRSPREITTISQPKAVAEPAGVVELDRQDDAAPRSRWPQWLNPFGKPKRIPLPLHELKEAGEAADDAGPDVQDLNGF